MSDRRPTLYLLPTTLSDVDPLTVMPARNVDVARTVKHFIVENIRSARRFLKRCDRTIDIDSLSFVELNEHTPAGDVEAMLRPMDEGFDMAVLSEAGCPAVADPGADAVAVAQRRGCNVEPLIGPSSILMALMASGFNGQRFAFAGYLPVDDSQRTAALREMQRRIERERQTQIFIETPYRNSRLLAALCRTLPASMMLCVATDITGPEQRILTRPLSWWAKSTELPKLPTIFLLFN